MKSFQLIERMYNYVGKRDGGEVGVNGWNPGVWEGAGGGGMEERGENQGMNPGVWGGS